MEVIDAIHSRRSIRRYLDVPVEWDKIGSILDAGRVAPSAGNLQAWRFVVVKKEEKRKLIAEACLQQYWMEQAPVFIVIFAELPKMEQHYGLRGVRFYSVQSCAMAAMQMMIAAESLGLGTCFVGAFDENAIARIFNLPDTARPQGVITIGYADEKPDMPLRYRLENIAWTEVFAYGMGRVADRDQVLWNFRYAQKASKFAQDTARDMQKVIKAKNFSIPFFGKKQEPAVEQLPIEGEGKVAKVGIKREDGYLYYIDSDGDISRSKMKKWHEKKT
ncbi:MAG: nitroreductase family protein [Candidatus Woesearchaeota archaeon]